MCSCVLMCAVVCIYSCVGIYLWGCVCVLLQRPQPPSYSIKSLSSLAADLHHYLSDG